MRWHKVRNKGYEKMKREELHKLLFETLCIIDDICKKENVRWFLDSGTELGSLREQDIIPWDDDMDIGMLRDEYESKVPEDFDALLRLPGVGRKSANLIMGDVFGKPAIVTDTHCIRLVNRMGLVDGIKEPKKVEMALWKLVPPEEGSDFCHRLVYHGRAVCSARTKPDCEHCCVKDVCVTACGVGTFGTESAVR